jgi:chaperonin GroES
VQKGAKMKIKPIFDRVVLLPKEADKETKSGIILPSVSAEKSQIATVVAVGEGGFVDGKEIKMQVKEGQEVLYAKYSGTEVSFDGQKYIVVKQSDILAVVEE